MADKIMRVLYDDFLDQNTLKLDHSIKSGIRHDRSPTGFLTLFWLRWLNQGQEGFGITSALKNAT